jgi:hypothetical protein
VEKEAIKRFGEKRATYLEPLKKLQKSGSPKKNKYMKSEDGWWILRSTARPRLRSNEKGSSEERKDTTDQ